MSNLYKDLANCIRILTMDAVERAGSGHPGMPMGMADVVTVLSAEFLNFSPNDPKWLNRDRLILSAGHGSMLLYSLLYLTGYKDISLDDIKNFRQLHGKTAGHPEYGLLAGVECSTGPLGQGFGNAVGFALAQKIHNARLGQNLLNHKIYTITGDGCLMEGISHEVASFAGHLNLDSLIVLYDSNNITIDGERSLADSEDVLLRFQSYGWHTMEIDGHDFAQIHKTFAAIQDIDKPTIIKCNTVIGYGAPTKSNSEKSHGAPLGFQEVMDTRKFLDWQNNEPFYIPEDLLKVWRGKIGKKSEKIYQEFVEKTKTLTENQQKYLKSLHHRGLPKNFFAAIDQFKKQWSLDGASEATRASSGRAIAKLSQILPNLIGGSADLTQSNNTRSKGMEAISKSNFNGDYIHYGIREHGMGAIMNGMFLYGGIIPYGGSFLVFSDYLRPSLRMSALTAIQAIYIMTHDSIGVGEDGPTHQPVEHLASLRAMPNLNVFRPADAIETLECWQVALEKKNTPSVLCLTRQAVPQIRSYKKENLCAKGGYIVSECNNKLDVTLFATGSELSIALEAQKELHKKAVGVRVISMPCFELFEQQTQEYQSSILANNSLKIAIEAATRFGWDRYIGKNGIFIGIEDFGRSGKNQDLYNYYKITVKNIVNIVTAKLDTFE